MQNASRYNWVIYWYNTGDMYQYKLQIPISRKLNTMLKTKAEELGLNSVTDIARMLLTNFASGKISLSFTPERREDEIATEALEKIIAKGLEEYKQGKTKKLNFKKPLHDQLMEDQGLAEAIQDSKNDETVTFKKAMRLLNRTNKKRR